MIMKKNIVLYVILSIVTCGVFYFVWIYQLDQDTAKASNTQTNAGMNILLTIITCGLYGFYLFYKFGERINQARLASGKIASPDTMLPVIYIILAVCNLSIVVLVLAQVAINDDFAQ